MIRFKEISEYRTQLMGAAMAFIMASHTIGRFGLYGNIGVEWFLILSGVGLYFSLQKETSTKNFYQRRFKKILPAYLIVAIPFFLIKFPFDLRDFLIRISGLNLIFMWERYFWFIALICLCYLIAPFYFKIVNSCKYSFLIPFVLALGIFFLSFHLPRTQILVTRFPIFLLGMHLGKAVYEDKVLFANKSSFLPFIISLAAIGAVVWINYRPHLIEVERQLYFLCGIPSLFFILFIIRKLALIRPVHRLLTLMGTVSLEIYLVHESIVFASCLLLPIPKIFAALLSYAIAIALAYVLHSLIKKII